MNKSVALPGQLSFEALLTDANAANEARKLDKEYGHLPPTMDAAVPFYRDLVQRHHAAMMAGDAETVGRLREEAVKLATKLNNYEAGILADENAPGCVLARLTQAKKNAVPLWGQAGSFEILHGKMRVRIEMEGLYGIGASHMSWLSFSAHAIERSKPFLSDTGYRSFLGVGGALEADYTPESFVKAVVASYVDRDLKGRLRKITPLTARKNR